jgi:hypothetical protein
MVTLTQAIILQIISQSNLNMSTPLPAGVNISPNAVLGYLDHIGFDCYYRLFEANGFDSLWSLSLMEDNDLKSIGVQKLGHRKGLLERFRTDIPGLLNGTYHFPTDEDIELDQEFQSLPLTQSEVRVIPKQQTEPEISEVIVIDATKRKI